ncbi:uncharacterized protein EI90DRAFT_3150174 [Cantharellus anzutake]|uniref:uncharacterized protein n=1 Tax=Cantharellus anzutake TaxID=1750568 RepID=UPI001903022E|nr:uncharacterized protein EI90DRAFT_3150174 [Cantharellus anzutake]KAF8342005.1 hypothetical protein EI90DRAFT_3150174 [Cantharellus anzutake]
MQTTDLGSRHPTPVSVSALHDVIQPSTRLVPSIHPAPIGVNDSQFFPDLSTNRVTQHIQTVLSERKNVNPPSSDSDLTETVFVNAHQPSLSSTGTSNDHETRKNASRFANSQRLAPRFPTSMRQFSGQNFAPRHLGDSNNTMGRVPGRTVSLPSSLNSSVPNDARQNGSSYRSNHRVISLPEVSMIPTQFSTPMRAVDCRTRMENELPLIDLSSPLQNPPNSVSLSPTGTVLIHSSFGSSGNQTISSFDSSDSEESICMGPGSPIVGRSSAVLRNVPCLDTVEINNDVPSSTKARTVKPVSAQVELQDGWISMSPQPIPALHGPPSLPRSSGAEGVLISEQSSLPRMIWGLDEQAPNSAPLHARLPHTPGFPPSSNFQPGQPREGQASDSATSAFPTPSSTVVATPSSIIDMPSETSDMHSPLIKPAVHMFVPHAGGKPASRATSERHSRKSSESGQVKVLGSPLQLATPGDYTEHRYIDSSEWEEFIPYSATETSIPNPQTVPSSENVSTSRASINTHVSHSPLASTLAPIQNSSHNLDLPAVTEMISNPANVAAATPEMWSLALRKFWAETFVHLEAQQRALLTQAALVQSGILTPSFTIPPGTSLSAITPLLPQPVASGKHEPYTGALDNPRSVPMQRLRRKLTTVKEEKENENDAVRNDLQPAKPSAREADGSNLQQVTPDPLPEKGQPVKTTLKAESAPVEDAETSSRSAGGTSSRQPVKRRSGSGRSAGPPPSAGPRISSRVSSSRSSKGPSLVQRVKESARSSGAVPVARKPGDSTARDGAKRKIRFGPPVSTS